jgi:enamine deaminase RidA (YjgF/YER057c/UK114 family)
MNILQPDGWQKPKGYSNGVLAEGRTIFVAGQVGWKADGEMVGTDIVAQTRQALNNIVDILAEGGAAPNHIARIDKKGARPFNQLP